MNDEYLKYKAENDLTGPWSINWSASISEPFKELVCLYILEWNYLGGAHGNRSEYYRFFSVPEGKPLFLADIFTDINRLNQITYFSGTLVAARRYVRAVKVLWTAVWSVDSC